MDKRFQSGKILTLLAIAAVIAAGCGKQETGTNAGPANSGTGSGGTKYRIAVIPKGTAQSFWQTVKAGAEKAGSEENAEIIFQGPTDETDISGQINIIDAQIVNHVDAIVLAACNATAPSLAAEVKKAQDAGIPVVTIDSGILPDTSIKFIATDNKKGGAAAADALNTLIGPAGGAVGLLPIIQGAGSSDDRENGFKTELAKYPQLHIVATEYSESDAAKAQTKINAMLIAHPEIKGIFAANQGGGIGAAQAIKQKGLAGKVKLVAYDASDEEITALKDGIIQALIVQRPFAMGYEGVKTAVEAIKAHKVKAEKPVVEDTGVTVVTMQNFNQPDIQKLLYPLK